ncbi:hypothetical protein EOD43_19205 [Sphingomonas crocodyli]|uniref:Uncharacterized protein n=1 Tax=Sphingomonas crocodyli TaxID=1979270 RepID=A0A437LYI1_9SPHN|nr:hypothetical protein EOD43_19205 [Sphingomonas crocodyli]
MGISRWPSHVRCALCRTLKEVALSVSHCSMKHPPRYSMFRVTAAVRSGSPYGERINLCL